MSNYVFKKNALVGYADSYPGLTSLVETVDFSFSQTFTDSTYTKKTLHEQHNLSDSSNISRANPGNFEFTVNVGTASSTGLNNLITKLLKPDSGTFDLIISSGFNLNDHDYTALFQRCVITNGTFIIDKLENLKITFTGECSKLLTGKSPLYNSVSQIISGSLGRNYVESQIPKYVSVKLPNSSAPIPCVTSLSVEVQNDIEWNPYTTVQKGIENPSDGDILSIKAFPENYTFKKRIISGSIGAYVKTDPTFTANGNFGDEPERYLQTYATDKTLSIIIGDSSTVGFKFNLLNCTYTNRVNPAEVFTQNYDWRMADNPLDLTDSSSDSQSYIKIQTT